MKFPSLELALELNRSMLPPAARASFDSLILDAKKDPNTCGVGGMCAVRKALEENDFGSFMQGMCLGVILSYCMAHSEEFSESVQEFMRLVETTEAVQGVALSPEARRASEIQQ